MRPSGVIPPNRRRSTLGKPQLIGNLPVCDWPAAPRIGYDLEASPLATAGPRLSEQGRRFASQAGRPSRDVDDLG
jgi:hypothetical protein